jgi:hypothetical protein
MRFLKHSMFKLFAIVFAFINFLANLLVFISKALEWHRHIRVLFRDVPRYH